MPIFILLSTLTQQGVTTLKSNPERLREVNKDVEELGCRVLHQWATLGSFDFVNVVEAPDIATVAKISVVCVQPMGCPEACAMARIAAMPLPLRATSL